MMTSTAESLRTPASVHERIRHKIVRNEIPPGRRVNIDSLARELGVSQTPIREALQRLEGENLVIRERGRGYATTELLTEAQLQHIFEVRMLLEPWACRVVAVDRAGNPGPALLTLVDEFESEHADVCARIDLAAHDTEFHTLIHASTANEFLSRSLAGLHAQANLFRLYGHDIDSVSTLTEHRDVAQAIADCDGSAAEEAMRTHLLRSLDRYLPALRGEAPNDFVAPPPARIR
ncbi:GntR family transcriptional regulator [Brevibacterium luteolum]|uniref:GntR family transcriptional regulator n=1 Tax=Brevibacterium luteolum TaxID=199591 RepID=UPI00223B43EB|nr:GntR family transcriptional regulator [Brevibacterium luteolum]MCT1829221.1 GntR family transcriptional regulator [Brevibacterium luteolum]